MQSFLSGWGASPASLLGLVSDGEDLEKLSTEELRIIHACERHRLGLIETVGASGGFLGVLLSAKYLLR